MLFPSFFNAGAPTYEIEQSLRFDGSAQLSWTPSSAGNLRTFTRSAWFKRAGKLDGYNIFASGINMTPDSGHTSQIYLSVGSSPESLSWKTTADWRDVSAWYHLVFQFDTTQATADDRAKLYINGVRVTDFWQKNSTPAQNYQSNTVNTATAQYIGGGYSNWYFDGYQAEHIFVDGQALDPEDFGEFDNNGVWRPKRYTGSYGTNGFYLKFDPSATNGIGHDHSGNGNHWTPTGFDTNPTSYVLATKTSGTFSTGTLRDVFDASSGAAGGVYQEATTGSTAASTIDIEFDSPLSGTITVEASDGTGGTNNGGQYQLIDSTDTVQVTQARPTNTTTFTHTGLSDITKLRMYGGSSGFGGILISRFESSDQTIRSADWLALTDVMSDTPTKNWCTLNPVDNGGATLAEGNLSWDSGSNQGTKSTFFVDSGKWYWELTSNESNLIGEHGVADASQGITGGTAYPGYAASSWGFSNSTGNKANNNSFTNIATTGSQNDVIMVALDMDNGKIWWGRNGTWFSSGDPAAGSNAAFTNLSGYNVSPMSGVGGAAAGAVIYNFGQRAFAYTPPTGFKALNTSNLPAPTVKDGSDYFNTVLYNGNASTQSITGVGFQPDWVWLKSRNNSYHNYVFDAVRGTGKQLYTNLTNEEFTSSGTLTSFDTDGFSIGNSANADINNSGATFVAWNWLAGNGTSSNTDGSITSTVSANPSAGFSIATYSANNTAGATFGHGLGVAPSMVIVKKRNAVERWVVYHKSISNQYIYLNETFAGETANAAFRFGNDSSVVAPSSTLVTIGTSNDVNGASGTYVAYCFAEVEGYSKFGSYTGNGSTDGPFVYCGFKPAWIMWKPTNHPSATDWVMRDATRDTYNVVSQYLLANTSGAEGTASEIDILSNGFKFRNNFPGNNSSGTTVVFAAFASSPFGGSGVSPATAR